MAPKRMDTNTSLWYRFVMGAWLRATDVSKLTLRWTKEFWGRLGIWLRLIKAANASRAERLENDTEP